MVEGAFQQQQQRLSKQQAADLAAALTGCWGRDAAGSTKVLLRSLDGDAKRELIAALESGQSPPGPSRCGQAGQLRCTCVFAPGDVLPSTC
jgi:hypothetical protein